MKKLHTEMDGFSVVGIDKKAKKSDIVLVTSSFERDFYRVSVIDGEEVKFKLFKYTTPERKETGNKYLYNGKAFYFKNRLSRNQTVYMDGILVKVINIDKSTKKISGETIPHLHAHALYEVNKDNEVLFVGDWGEAYSLVLNYRSQGIRAFL